MARIRTVKPTYPKHPKVRRVCRDARLLNIHLWNLADDEGRLQELPNSIIGEVFPTDDDVTPVVLREWLRELHGAGLIVRYSVDGEDYIQCHDFSDHQVINKPRPSDLPPPEPNSGDSGSPTVVIRDDYREEEEEEKEGNKKTASSADKPPTEVEQVFNAWVEATGKNPNQVKFTEKRRRLIARQLKDYPVADLIDAVHGWRHSPHHRGENQSRTVYNSIELLLRDAEKIEFFRDLERRHRPRQQEFVKP